MSLGSPKLLALLAAFVCLVVGQDASSALPTPPVIGDPLHVTASRGIAYPGERQVLVIGAANADGSGRTGIASTLRVDVFDPDNILLVSGATPTEITAPLATGNYRYGFDLGAQPKLGSHLVVVRTTDLVPASASTAFNVAGAPPATLAQLQSVVGQAQAAITAHVDAALDESLRRALEQANVTFQVENITVDHLLLQRIDQNLTHLDNETQAHAESLLQHRSLSPEYTAEEAQQSWLETIGQLAWVIWGLYFVASRFVHPTLLRVLVDLVGFGLLALPIPEGQVDILFFAPLAATGWDAFRYAEEHL